MTSTWWGSCDLSWSNAWYHSRHTVSSLVLVGSLCASFWAVMLNTPGAAGFFLRPTDSDGEPCWWAQKFAKSGLTQLSRYSEVDLSDNPLSSSCGKVQDEAS